MDLSMIFSVVTINLLLSSDNALAIAMASRNLEPNYRKKAVLWGSICAVLIQIMLTYAASLLLTIPYLKIAGGAVLAWIAAKMITDDETDDKDTKAAAQSSTLWGAIRAIAIANLIMSLDNVLAVAAVAEGNSLALGLGVIVSFPIIMWGSVLISSLLEKFPVLVWMGAVFLGWTAGGIISSDAIVAGALAYSNISQATVSAILSLGVSFLAWRTAMTKVRASSH